MRIIPSIKKKTTIRLNKVGILFFITFISFNINAQIISYFSWDGGDIRVADIGPDFLYGTGTSTAFSDANGVEGTNGLNAGPGNKDLNLVLANSSIFDVNGIDVSFDFQRDESVGAFFTRGSSLKINGCANLSVSYRVDDGSGGFVTVNSGNVYSISDDAIFRNYRFVYLPSTGVGTLSVDGVVKWTHDGPDNRNMYWTGAGNIIIGKQIDGSGRNNTILDNLKIGEVYDSPLPIELVNFQANLTQDNKVKIDWATATEINNSHFSIERAQDAKNWRTIKEVDGANNSNELISYSTFDENPVEGIAYYRLKQTDFDGMYTYSDIVVLEVGKVEIQQ